MFSGILTKTRKKANRTVTPQRPLTDDPVVLRMTALLKKSGKTEKQLIDHLGMARGTFTVWKYNSGKSYGSHINEIAEFLNVSPNYLLRGVDEETDVETLSETEINLVKTFRSFDIQKQKYILKTMDYLDRLQKTEEAAS